ncbi:MAG: hypothetical protein P8Z00_21930 [Anaerolineales bacterium]|jgi:hypothetical protein
MKLIKGLREFVLLVIGLGIVALVTAAIISTLRGPAQGSATVAISPSPTSSTQLIATSTQESTTTIPYPYPLENQLTPSAAAAKTAAGLLSTKEILIKTYLAITPSPTLPITPFPTGIINSNIKQKASGKLLGLDTQNVWVGLVAGNEADVTAGALLSDPEQGAIYLVVSIPRDGVMEQILTPTKHGAVRVVSEQHNRLTLVSNDGTVYYFDVPARRFVGSLTEVVPRATPPFTFTPLPTLHVIWTSTPVPPTYNPYPAPTGQSTAAP